MNRKDYVISEIRLLATILVFGVHVCQKYEWTYISDWCNLGVQLFFCISAYLYCGKKCGQIIVFWYRRYITIIVPVAIAVVLALMFGHPKNIVECMHAAIGLAGLTKVPDVFRHLWYITYILAMYMCLPLLEILPIEKMDTKPLLIVLIGGNIVLAAVFMTIKHYTPTNMLSMAHISCFVIPYYLSKKWDIEDVEFKSIIRKWMIAAIIVNIVTIVMRYNVFSFTLNISDEVKELLYLYAHTMIGIPLFYILYRCINKKTIHEWILDISDEYSYQFYVIHCIIILELGSLSWSHYKALSIIATFILSLCASVLLNHISSPIIRILLGDKNAKNKRSNAGI